MAGTASRINFAAIGHQDSWDNIERFVNGMRAPGQDLLTVEKIKNIFPYIPPRVLFNVNVKSITGKEINGVYIDTFIDPDKLDARHARTNIKKVIQAAACAGKEGAAIATLGGFTSIVLEGNFDAFPQNGTAFSTGNTLTAAYIVKGLEQAAAQCRISLADSTLLIVGATGDIGLACVDYFKKKVKRLLLCARNLHRIEQLADRLSKDQVNAGYDVSVERLLPGADVIICVASATELDFRNCKKNVLICDAGYPKNLGKNINDNTEVQLFHGGMGQVSKGYAFDPDYSDSIYHYPAPGIVHGCLLEAIVLAFEDKIEHYSMGKGNITIAKMEEIYAIGLRHGITLAPLHNANGLWSSKNRYA
jgi:fatty aldehyde-generating acyl-ACP reductase